MKQIADVDAIQSKRRKAGGKRARRPAVPARMDLLEISGLHEPSVRALPPVVEVPGNHERRIARNPFRNQSQQALDLLCAVRLPQGKVYADRVKRTRRFGHLDHAMQHSPTFGPSDRGIEILPGNNRVFGQERIAVMAAGSNRIAPVSVLRPDPVSQHLVLLGWRIRPMRDTDFLEENEFRIVGSQRVAQPQECAATTESSEALVGIQCQQPDGARFRHNDDSRRVPVGHSGIGP